MTYYVLLTFLIPRLIFQWTDERDTLKDSIYILLINCILLLPVMTTLNRSSLLISIFTVHLIIHLTENKFVKFNINAVRLIQFILILIFVNIFNNGFGSEYQFNQTAHTFWTWLAVHNTLIRNGFPSQLLIYLTGLFILINESNHLIRYILHKIKVQPIQNKEVDKNELTRGKIIGALERIIIYSFAMAGNLSSIGFILAAKAFTRFKELDDKEFAEYVLIGTLLSASITIFIAYLFRYFLELIN